MQLNRVHDTHIPWMPEGKNHSPPSLSFSLPALYQFSMYQTEYFIKAQRIGDICDMTYVGWMKIPYSYVLSESRILEYYTFTVSTFT